MLFDRELECMHAVFMIFICICNFKGVRDTIQKRESEKVVIII